MISKNTKEYIKNKKAQGLYGVDFVDAVHPGGTLQDEIDFFGISQKELAKKIGYSKQTINRIVKEKEPITMDIALALERVFDGRPSSKFWLDMQVDYDKEISKLNELADTQKEISYFKKEVRETFKELQKGGVFDNYSLNTEENYKESIIKTKDFYGSCSLQTIPEEFLLGVPFRKYTRDKTNKFSLAAILKIGEKKARKILRENNISEYSESIFKQKIELFRSLSNKKSEEFLELLQKECLSVGVVVVYVPNMKNTHFGGVRIWVGKHPVVLLKVENQREDVFWFNFFHEAGHVLMHGKRETQINFNDKRMEEKDEIEADEFAEKTLIPNFEKISGQVEKGLSVDKWIDVVSEKTRVSKSIVAGRLCNVVSFKNAWKELSQYRPIIKKKISFV